MKKITAALIAIVLTLALGACAAEPKTETGSIVQGTQVPVDPGTATQAPGDASAEPGVATADPGNTEKQPVVGSEGLVIDDYGDYCVVTDIGTFSGTELIIPSHVDGKPVTTIDEDALFTETAVTLYIPWTVEYIREDAVSSCTKLESVTFSEGLISIGWGSFGGCTMLKTVTLPSTLERISSSAFRDCASLEEVTILGNPEVNSNAFTECPSLKKVTFSGNSGAAYKVESSAFESDASLETVNFSAGLESIGSFCFAGCTSLSAVYLPASLTKIESSAFQNIGSGTLNVYYAGSEDSWNNISIASGNEALLSAEIVYNYAG